MTHYKWDSNACIHYFLKIATSLPIAISIDLFPRTTVKTWSDSILSCRPRNCFSFVQSLKAVTTTTTTTARRMAPPNQVG